MHLYHGTSSIVGKIDFGKCRLRTDFGRGFYLTDKLGTAQAWAKQRAATSGGIPTVMKYVLHNDILHDAKLNRLRFDNPTVAWLNFVRDNRRRGIVGSSSAEPRHSYDIVSGPIANDKVAYVVEDYCKNLINAEEAVRQMSMVPDTYQLSLHTNLSLSYIQSSEFRQYKGSKWHEWANDIYLNDQITEK